MSSPEPSAAAIGSLAMSDLRAGIRHLRDGDRPQQRLAKRLEYVLQNAHLGVTFEAALQLPSRWWQAEPAATCRTRLLLELTAHYDGALSARAVAIERDAQRYAATAWPRHADQVDPPSGDLKDQLFWRLHRNAELGCATWPLKKRQIFTLCNSAP